MRIHYNDIFHSDAMIDYMAGKFRAELAWRKAFSDSIGHKDGGVVLKFEDWFKTSISRLLRDAELWAYSVHMPKK